MKQKSLTRKLFFRNMRNLTIILILIIALYIYHMTSTFVYVKNYFSRGAEIHFEQLESEIGTRTIAPEEQSGKDQGYMAGFTGFPEMFYEQYVYWEGSSYRFRLTPTEIIETGIYYNEMLEPTFGMSSPDEYYELLDGIYAASAAAPLERIILMRFEGCDMLIPGVIPYYIEINAGEEQKAVLSQLGEYMAVDLGHALYLEGGESYDICRYFVDLRGVPVEYEDEDGNYTIFYTIVLALVLFLVVLFYCRPGLHPFYRQLKKYGAGAEAVAAEIDAEYAAGAGVTEVRGQINTPTWYIKSSPFMNVVTKNVSAGSKGEAERLERMKTGRREEKKDESNPMEKKEPVRKRRFD